MDNICFEWFALFTLPGFAFRLGVMMAVTLILGFILYDEWAKVWKWIIVVVAFAFFYEWIHSVVEVARNTNSVYCPAQPILTVSIFILSLLAGVTLARYFNRRQEREIEAAKEVYKNLKDKKNNGGFPKIDCTEVQNET